MRIAAVPVTAESIWTYATRTLTGLTGTPRSDLLGSDEPISTSTVARLANLDNLDVAVSTRPSGADYTAARAANLDNLDVAVSTRATPLTFSRYAVLTLAAGATYTPAAGGVFTTRRGAQANYAAARVEYYHPINAVWYYYTTVYQEYGVGLIEIGDGTNMRYKNGTGSSVELVIFRMA